LGAGSQDYGKEDARFEKLTDGSSALGRSFIASLQTLKSFCLNAEEGPLSRPESAVRANSSTNPKLQGDITKQIEDHRAKVLAERHKAHSAEDRRRISYENRLPSTLAFATTAPTKATMVPKPLFTGAVALVMGALDPAVLGAYGARIGNTNMRVDLYGDALGAAVLPGDRWRRVHDIFKDQIYLDAKYLGVVIQKEVYGMFSRYFDTAGNEGFNRLSDREKRTQAIVPDLVTSHHPADSVIAVSGPQMWELKRIQSVSSFNRSGRATGQNEYYQVRQRGRLVRATDRRAAKVPLEYAAKAKRADECFVAPGNSAVREALQALPQVRGIALGAFGEFSESINILIEGLAHEGALKNPNRFGQGNYQAAFGAIHWWLKRRWARLAVITAVESRYAALGYTGGTAQQQAAAAHAQAQAKDDWRDDSAYRQREAETASPFFGEFWGG